MCIDYNIPEPEVDADMIDADLGIYEVNLDDHEEQVPVGHAAARINPDLAAGRALQRHIIRTHFNEEVL